VTDRVAGRTALVTGAGNGLGRRISVVLAARGARVVLVGRNPGNLAVTAKEVRGAGGNARELACDISSPDAVEAAAAALADEEISILVNNAGVAGPVAPLVDIGPADWDDVFAVNVRGVYLMCRAFLPSMIGRGNGDIINLASVSGKRPLAGRTPYAASKMAVIGLTATLAHEAGAQGVNVNSLSPGPVRGPRMDRNFTLDAGRRGISPAEAEQELISRAALGRMIEEREVADAVLAMLHMPGLCGADIDLSAGMIAR
jgi:NAD(P)-dependent dehydrogenase (short-subunit alcohol dehydrogenase family)